MVFSPEQERRIKSHHFEFAPDGDPARALCDAVVCGENFLYYILGKYGEGVAVLRCVSSTGGRVKWQLYTSKLEDIHNRTAVFNDGLCTSSVAADFLSYWLTKPTPLDDLYIFPEGAQWLKHTFSVTTTPRPTYTPRQTYGQKETPTKAARALCGI